MCIELLPSNRMYANSLSASMYVRRLVYPTQPSNSVATTHPYFRCGDNCQVTSGGLGEIQYPIPPATHADSDGELARSGFTQLSPQQRLYQERAVTVVKMPEGFRAQTAEDYRQGLTAARAIAERSHCPKHAGLVAEWTARFVVFLAGVPPPYGPQNTRTATPEDVLNFCTMYAMVHHGITKLGDGSVVPAFSTMKGILSNIRHTFDVLGRRGEWQPLTLSGNPCDSTEIREFRTGYERTLWIEGVEPVAATPATEKIVRALVDEADKRHSVLAATPVERRSALLTMRLLILERDITLYLYLWESIQRGGEGGRLRPCDLRGGDGAHFPLPTGGGPPLFKYPIRAHPNGVKTRQRRACGSFSLTGCGDIRYDFVARLNRFLRNCYLAGQYAGPDTPIFRTLQSGKRTCFSAEALNSAASLKRLYTYRQSASGGTSGPLGTATGHSFRRGGIQDDKAKGKAPEATMARGLMTSKRTYELYSDTERPTKCKRARVPGALVAPAPPAAGVGAFLYSTMARAVQACTGWATTST